MRKESKFERNFALFEKSRKEGETIHDIMKDLKKYHLRGNKVVEEVLKEFVEDWGKQQLQEISDCLKEHLKSKKINNQ